MRASSGVRSEFPYPRVRDSRTAVSPALGEAVRGHSRTLAQATAKGLLVGPDASAGANRDARLPVLLSGWRVAVSEVVRILRIACRSRTWELPLQRRRIKETKPDVLPEALGPTRRAALCAIWIVVLSGVASPGITVRHAGPG